MHQQKDAYSCLDYDNFGCFYFCAQITPCEDPSGNGIDMAGILGQTGQFCSTSRSSSQNCCCTPGIYNFQSAFANAFELPFEFSSFLAAL